MFRRIGSRHSVGVGARVLNGLPFTTNQIHSTTPHTNVNIINTYPINGFFTTQRRSFSSGVSRVGGMFSTTRVLLDDSTDGGATAGAGGAAQKHYKCTVCKKTFRLETAGQAHVKQQHQGNGDLEEVEGGISIKSAAAGSSGSSSSSGSGGGGRTGAGAGGRPSSGGASRPRAEAKLNYSNDPTGELRRLTQRTTTPIPSTPVRRPLHKDALTFKSKEAVMREAKALCPRISQPPSGSLVDEEQDPTDLMMDHALSGQDMRRQLELSQLHSATVKQRKNRKSNNKNLDSAADETSPAVLASQHEVTDEVSLHIKRLRQTLQKERFTPEPGADVSLGSGTPNDMTLVGPLLRMEEGTCPLNGRHVVQLVVQTSDPEYVGPIKKNWGGAEKGAGGGGGGGGPALVQQQHLVRFYPAGDKADPVTKGLLDMLKPALGNSNFSVLVKGSLSYEVCVTSTTNAEEAMSDSLGSSSGGGGGVHTEESVETSLETVTTAVPYLKVRRPAGISILPSV